MKTKRALNLLALALVTIVLTGCLGIGQNKTATVGLFLTDTGQTFEAAALGLETSQEGQEIEEVWVTITAIYAKRDSGWEKLFDVPQDQQQVNLMDLHLKAGTLGRGQSTCWNLQGNPL